MIGIGKLRGDQPRCFQFNQGEVIGLHHIHHFAGNDPAIPEFGFEITFFHLAGFGQSVAIGTNHSGQGDLPVLFQHAHGGLPGLRHEGAPFCQSAQVVLAGAGDLLLGSGTKTEASLITVLAPHPAQHFLHHALGIEGAASLLRRIHRRIFIIGTALLRLLEQFLQVPCPAVTFHETAQQFPKGAVCPILTQLAPSLLHLFRCGLLAILLEPPPGAVVLEFKAEQLGRAGSFPALLLGFQLARKAEETGAGSQRCEGYGKENSVFHEFAKKLVVF